MKKYLPSVTENIKFKQEIENKISNMIYSLKFDNYTCAPEKIKDWENDLQNTLRVLQNSIGTGHENIFEFYSLAKDALNNFKKSASSGLITSADKNLKNLLSAVEKWNLVLLGEYYLNTQEQSKDYHNIETRIDKLKDIKEFFLLNIMETEKKVNDLESLMNELNSNILACTNEDEITDLYYEIQNTNKTYNEYRSIKNQNSTKYKLIEGIILHLQEKLRSDSKTAKLKKINIILRVLDGLDYTDNMEKTHSVLKLMKDELMMLDKKSETITKNMLNISETSDAKQLALKYRESLLAQQSESQHIYDQQLQLNKLLNKQNKNIEGEF